MDGDRDGRITKEEFLRWALNNKQKGSFSNSRRPTFNPSDFQTLVNSDSDQEISRLVNKIFASVDSDGNGVWSYDELQSMFHQMAYHYSVQNGELRPSDQEIEAFARNAFYEMDEDHDGTITKFEFLNYVLRNKKQPEYSSNFGPTYDSLSNKHNRFNAGDFLALSKSSDDFEIRRLVDKIFSAVDTDGSKTWSYNEVKDMFQNVGYYFALANGQ